MQTLLSSLRNRARVPILGLSLVTLFASSGPVSGADYHWDTDGSELGNDPEGSGLGGTGIWDLVSNHWWPVPAATLTTWGNTSADRAFFAYPFPTTPYAIPVSNSVTLSSGIIANQILFHRSGYTLSGGDLTLDGSNPGFYVHMGESASIATRISGGAGLLKLGGGTIRLTNALNDYTGTINIAGGSLIINSAAALGGTGIVNVTAGNGTPSNTGVQGFTGGSLVLDGSAAGFTFSRDLNLEGRGPIGNNSASLVSIGNNTLSGTINSAFSTQTPTTFRNTRLTSANGTLNLSGTLNVLGTAGTTVTTLGGGNQAGVGNYNLTGILAGSGTLEKSGGGVLFLNPSNTAGFTGRVRVSGSAAVGQSSVRVSAANVFGTAHGAGNTAAIDMNGGVLEIRSDSSLNFGKNVYHRAASTFFVGPGVGGSGVNGTATFGAFHSEVNLTATFNSRNGYGLTFGAFTLQTSVNPSTFTNNMGGTLTFTGDFWNNSDGTDRTLTIGSVGNTFIGGSINSSGAGVKTLTKTGAGLLSIAGTATTLNGPVNIQAGAIAITDFRSLNNNTSAIVLGNTTTTGGNLIIGGTGGAATAAGLTTSKTITLNTTTAANSIYANQTGSDPVILNGAITKIATATTGALILGGTSTADNIINVVIPVEPTPSTGGVTKLGAGTWVLNAANTYRGATTIQNGILKLRATAGASDVIGSLASNTIVFSADAITQSAGGTLEFRGFLDTVTTEELGALTPTAGAAKIVTVANGSGSAALTFTSLGARGAGAYVDYQVGAGTTLLFGTAPAVTNNILGAASVSAFQTFNGVDWATLSGSQVVQYTGYTALPVSFSGTGGAAVNYSLAGNAASTGTASINTLKLTGSGANPTLTLGGILTLTARAILFDNSAGIGTITGSQLGAVATEVHVITNGTASANGGVAGVPLTLGNALTINSLIGGTTGSFTKSGTGTLIVGGNNTFTGVITINEGIVQLSGGTATLGVNSTAANSITVRQGATLDINAAGVSQTIHTGALAGAGVITNSGGGTGTMGTISFGRSTSTGATIFSGILQNGGGVLNVTIDGTIARTQSFMGLNTYTGVTTIATGAQLTVDVLANGGTASGIGASTSAAGNLVFDGSAPTLIYRGNLRDGSLNLGSTSAETNRLFTISGIGAVLSSTATNNNAIVWTNPGAIVHGTNMNRTITFTGTSQGDNTFIPQITNATGFLTSVTKTGTGIWHLRAANNNYGGATLIQQGILGATDGEGLSSNSNLLFDGGTLYSQGDFIRNIGTGPGEMQFLAPATDTAQFSGGFLGGDSKLTVNWAGTPVWGGGAGFIDTRDGLMLNGSQARGQGATGSIALSEVEIAGNFSLGTGGGTGKAVTVSTTNASAAITITAGDTSGLVVGQSFSGAGIASGAYIVSINSATTLTLSANSSATATLVAATAEASTLRAIRVDDNGNTGADFAKISGIISAGDATTGIRKLGTGTLALTGANTYTGETNVNQGFLEVLSLGQSGSAGATSVGDQLNANLNSSAITLGNGGTGGASLQYVGAGEISDRKIRLNSTTGSTQIHSDGAGALILTNVANDMVAGAKTFFLRGTNNAGNMITSQLSDNGGALAITIDSNAAWILTNSANNYTGTTTVSSGALGIGHDSAIGGAILTSNGNIFAYGGDRAVSNTLTLNNNANWGFLGDYNLTFNTVVLGTSANSNILFNSIAAGKALTFNGLTANSLTDIRSFTVDGPGETVINGDLTTNTAFGLNILKTGDGTLTLGGDGTVSNWNKVGTGIDVDRGTLKFISNNAINTTAGYAGLTISPELVTADTATLDLNGTTQTVNAFTGITDGTIIIDNTSDNAATFRFGANNSAVNFGSGVGTYTVQNTGNGALSLVKLGNTTTTFISGITLGHKGVTASEGGGVFNIASSVTATTGLRAIGASALNLSGGLPNGNLITSVEVGGGSTLSLLDGTGTQMSNLTSLNLGNTGTGTVTLNLNIGDLLIAGDELSTDSFTLLSGGALSLGNTVTFNLTDAGLNANTTYTLINSVDGGLITGPLVAGNWIQGATPGGFDSFTWFVDDNVVQITTGNLIVGDLYWRGLTNTTWNANTNNWSTDKAGTTPGASIPGQGTNVIFAYNGVGAGALTTTLEQNFKINSLVFESGTTTPTSVTINPGAVATARLEIAPSSSANGITITNGGPASVTIGANFRLGSNQTWDITGASTLTLSGMLFGEADVTKSGAGRVVLSGVADPTFNSGVTTDFTVSAGNLEVTNLAALGTLANSNLARIIVSGGGFYYNNAVSGTFINDVTLSGGTLSAGGATQTYSDLISVTSASSINLRDSNSATVSTTARNITLSGGLTGNGNLTVDSIDTLTAGNQETGTLTLNQNNNAWTGNWNFLRGTVSTNNANGLGAGSAINFQAGRIVFAAGAGSVTLAQNITVASATGTSVGELNLATGIPLVVNGVVTLGGVGGFGELRVDMASDTATANLSGGVVLANNGGLGTNNAATRLLTVDSIISETGGSRTLTINDAGFGSTAGIVRLTQANTFTGNVIVSRGILEFNTVTNAGGAASSLGQGNAITTVGASTIRFIGTSAQSTNRTITSGTGALTLSANGATVADTITYNGAITITPTGDGSQMILTGAAGAGEGLSPGGLRKREMPRI